MTPRVTLSAAPADTTSTAAVPADTTPTAAVSDDAPDDRSATEVP